MQEIQNIMPLIIVLGIISLISYGLGKLKPGLVFLLPGLMIVIGGVGLVSVLDSGSWEGLIMAFLALFLIGGGVISGIISLVIFLSEKKKRSTI